MDPSETDVSFQFSNRRDEDLKTTAVLQLTFPEQLRPKKDEPLTAEIEYLPGSGTPLPHQGKVSIVRWGRTEVFDPESEFWEKIEGAATATIHFVQQRFDGQLSFRLQWTAHDDSQQERTHRCAAGQELNRRVTEEVIPYAPSLAQYLKSPSLEYPLQQLSGTGRQAEAHAVGVVLRHIYTKLRWGFGNFWASQGPKAVSGAKALSEVRDNNELKGLTPAQLDEAWAQLISEALVGTCYQGPGSFMAVNEITLNWPQPQIPGVGDGHNLDASIMQAVLSGGQFMNDPFIPVVFACQQLVSWALLYRGYTEIAENPADAELWGNTGKVNSAERVTGNQGILTAQKLQQDSRLRPGTCMYRGKTGQAMALRHVGFTLRADTVATRLQLGDTGGWVSSGLGSGQNFDTEALFRMAYPCDGILVCPTAEERRNDLTKGIRALHQARPLAAGQLVIARRGSSALSERLLWVSKALPLYEGDGGERVCFPISKLAHALRSLPFSQLLDVRWRVWAPRGDAVAIAVDEPGRWIAQTQEEPPSGKAVIEIGSTQDGNFSVLQRTKQHLGSGAAPAEVAFEAPNPLHLSKEGYPSLVEPMGQIPGYFR